MANKSRATRTTRRWQSVDPASGGLSLSGTTGSPTSVGQWAGKREGMRSRHLSEPPPHLSRHFSCVESGWVRCYLPIITGPQLSSSVQWDLIDLLGKTSTRTSVAQPPWPAVSYTSDDHHNREEERSDLSSDIECIRITPRPGGDAWRNVESEK